MKIKTDAEMEIMRDMIRFGTDEGFLYGGKVFKEYINKHPELASKIDKRKYMPFLVTYFNSLRNQQKKGWMDYKYGFKSPKE